MQHPARTKHGMQVISGGQTGVDIAALRAAQCFGLKTGGLAPRGFKTTAGPKPALKTTFNVKQGDGGYSDRTRKNIEEAAATLVLARTFDSSGTKLTLSAAEASSKPVHRLQLPPVERIVFAHADLDASVSFIEERAKLVPEGLPFVLNIAGNSSKTSPGVFITAFVALAEIFTRLALKLDPVEGEQVAQFKERLLRDPRMIHALVDNYDYYGELDPRGLRGLIV